VLCLLPGAIAAPSIRAILSRADYWDAKRLRACDPGRIRLPATASAETMRWLGFGSRLALLARMPLKTLAKCLTAGHDYSLQKRNKDPLDSLIESGKVLCRYSLLDEQFRHWIRHGIKH
jgi:hypothetical protein